MLPIAIEFGGNSWCVDEVDCPNEFDPGPSTLAALEYAILCGANIINISWGFPTDVVGLSALIGAAASGLAGSLVVVAAGNNGLDLDSEQGGAHRYPQVYNFPHMIVVAAIDQSFAIANFSNRGTTSVHIAAPGVDIVALAPQAAPPGQHPFCSTTQSGTSFAAPFVVGAAALIWTKYPTWNAYQVRERILSSGTFEPSHQGKSATSRILNLGAALE